VWECVFSLLSFPSRSFFLSLFLTLLPPPFFSHSFLPSTMVLPTTICQTKSIIFIVYSFSILSLNLFFYWRYFLGFQTATFIVRSWLPWNVFRKISTLKVLSFIFPTKPTKKKSCLDNLAPATTTAPENITACQKYLFNVCSNQN